MTDGLQGLDDFRSRRREREAAVLPLATSLDGSRFSLQASLHGPALRVGGYLEIGEGRDARLGQLLDLDAREIAIGGEPLRIAQGGGVMLGGDEPFHDLPVRSASRAAVEGHMAGEAPGGAGLHVGELSLAPGVPVRVGAGGFGRHTFLCGQSGSGKTYSLGVLLDRLLLETGLRIVILDPNSDFARLAESHPRAAPDDAQRWGTEVAPGIAVRRGGASGAERLRLRFGELSPEAQAALLRLDPIADREEYAVLAEVVAESRPEAAEELIAWRGDDDRARLGMRIRNLGVDRLGVWARTDAGSVLDDLRDPRVRCLVVDLGSLGSRQEQSLTAAAVLGRLWRTRAEREPVLIVIDEAHNVCPADPADAMTALARRTAIDIAAEGRKFGLYLLLSTQRPQKVAENVLSQCDNLVLMRLNSEADGAFARELFSFVPRGLVARAPQFRQGEALLAGPIAPHPLIVRFAARISAEGGADVPATWAQGPPAPT